MTFDVATRHQLALDPSALTSISVTLVAMLQAACRRKLAHIARFPTLLALAARGVEYDSIAKDRFHAEGRAALSALADTLAIDPGNYELTAVVGDRSESGCLRLATASFVILLRIGGTYQHREVLYRAVRDARETAPNHHAPIRALLTRKLFAEHLCHDLALPLPAAITDDPAPCRDTAKAA